MHQLIDIKRRLQEGVEVYDDEIDFLLNPRFQLHADRHFTSIHIAKLAVNFLAEKGESHILDIGSGTGKFCLVGAMLSSSKFTGIEYRSDFVDEAQKLVSAAELENVDFVNANILDCSFKEFSAFYMFNPFLEQIDSSATMGSGAKPSAKLHRQYHQHVAFQLDQCPPTTRLVTYYVNEKFVPESYVPIKKMFQNTLVFWEKLV